MIRKADFGQPDGPGRFPVLPSRSVGMFTEYGMGMIIRWEPRAGCSYRCCIHEIRWGIYLRIGRMSRKELNPRTMPKVNEAGRGRNEGLPPLSASTDARSVGGK
jgi:hypothetical protein